MKGTTKTLSRKTVRAKRDVTVTALAATNTGRVRAGNEDNFLIADLNSGKSWTFETGGEITDLLALSGAAKGVLCAVSDGMGGAAAGEVASQLAVEWVGELMTSDGHPPILKDFPFHEKLRSAVEVANLEIAIAAEHPEYEGMGATFTAAGVFDGKLTLAQIGDSRVYLLRNGNLLQLTQDQSLVAQLVLMGTLTEEEAETHPYHNVILQALGATPEVHVVVQHMPLCRGDLILICSDGLSNKVKKPEMFKILSDCGADLSKTARRLIDSANQAGGEDNITVLLMLIDGDLLPSPDEHQLDVPPFLERRRDLPPPSEIRLHTAPNGKTREGIGDYPTNISS